MNLQKDGNILVTGEQLEGHNGVKVWAQCKEEAQFEARVKAIEEFNG